MGDIEEYEPLPPGARHYLIASVLLTFAAQVMAQRPLRPACSLAGQHSRCLDETNHPRAAYCVYCALAQARIWYTVMTGTPAADMVEALTVAYADVEHVKLHALGGATSDQGRRVDRMAPLTLTNLARNRLRAATAGAPADPSEGNPHA